MSIQQAMIDALKKAHNQAKPSEEKEEKPKYTLVNYVDFSSDTFTPPSRFYVRNACGDYAFFHFRDRQKAQDAADEMYGKGRYKIVQAGLATGDRSKVNVRGTQTRKGQRKY